MAAFYDVHVFCTKWSGGPNQPENAPGKVDCLGKSRGCRCVLHNRFAAVLPPTRKGMLHISVHIIIAYFWKK